MWEISSYQTLCGPLQRTLGIGRGTSEGESYWPAGCLYCGSAGLACGFSSCGKTAVKAVALVGRRQAAVLGAGNGSLATSWSGAGSCSSGQQGLRAPCSLLDGAGAGLYRQ